MSRNPWFAADGIRDSAATGKAVSELIVSGKTEMPLDAFRIEASKCAESSKLKARRKTDSGRCFLVL
jgi:hypothetical protein